MFRVHVALADMMFAAASDNPTQCCISRVAHSLDRDAWQIYLDSWEACVLMLVFQQDVF